MANFNGFLDNLAQGALNPKGNLADFRHASRTFVDDSFRLAPKAKFLFLSRKSGSKKLAFLAEKRGDFAYTSAKNTSNGNPHPHPTDRIRTPPNNPRGVNSSPSRYSLFLTALKQAPDC